ncbi:uncharacterized protein LOC105771016 [Gossypium raimondii]|uniref:uncharacterized protein LOC105771016 n=1 Tax=Gossypium raimondii TaxID=29730 RepID=UPI00227A0AB1|nr:uncharacterized protein LOC105771016 [Gossypium raimondii]
MKDSQDYEDNRDCDLSPDLLRMVEQYEKQILPYKESMEIVSLGEEKKVKIEACNAAETKRDLIGLLQEFKDVFAWSYQDMPGLTVKGSAIADFLASRALEDYDPLNFNFPNEDLMYVVTTEEDFQNSHPWKLNFDEASNIVGNKIGAVLVSPKGDHYPFTSKLDFDCTNNMPEYEACIMGIRAAIERKVKVLEVYGDSALVIYQLKGEWETRDPKLINYRKLVLKLIKKFDDITFCYLPREENQMADALAILAFMVNVNK